jgi:dihydroorotase
LTKGSEGKRYGWIIRHENCWSYCFGDYNKSQDNANLLKIAICTGFWRISDCISQDKKNKRTCVVNEGVVSTRLGLKGIPNLWRITNCEIYFTRIYWGKLHIQQYLQNQFN